MIRAPIESTIGALTRTLRSARVEPDRPQRGAAGRRLLADPARRADDHRGVQPADRSSTRTPSTPSRSARPRSVPSSARRRRGWTAAPGRRPRPCPRRRGRGPAVRTASRGRTAASRPSRPTRPPSARSPRPPPSGPAGSVAARPRAGSVTSPFGSVDTPSRPSRLATESRPGEPPYPDLPRPRTTAGHRGTATAHGPRRASVTPAAGFTGTGGPPPPPRPRRTAGSSRRRPLIVAALVAALVLLAGGVTYVLLRPPSATSGATASAPTPVLLPPPAQKVARQAAHGRRERAHPGDRRGDPGRQHAGLRRHRAERHVRLRREPRGRRRHRRRHRDRQGRRDDPAAGRPAAVPRVRPDGSRLYVSVFKDSDRSINEVAVLDTRTNTVLTTIKVGTRPYALAVRPDGSEIYVPNHDSGTVSVIETKGEHAGHRHPGQAEPALGRLLQGRHPGLHREPRLEPDQRDRHRHARGPRRDPGASAARTASPCTRTSRWSRTSTTTATPSP